MTRICSWSLALLLLAEAILSPVDAFAQKPGQTWESPLQNFSLIVPDLPLGTKVKKTSGKNGGSVLFLGGAGESRQVQFSRLVPVPATLDSSTLDSLVAQQLRRALTDANAALLEEDRFSIGDTDVLFATASYPGGSAAVDMRSGKKFDAVRGLLGFAKGGFLYVLVVEPGGMFAMVNTTEERAKNARRMIQEFYASITFH